MDNNTINLNGDKEEDIQEIKELTIENNKMLHAIQRRARLTMVWRAFYWTVIIGIGFGAFYFAQPYVEKIKTVYTGIQTTQNKINDIPQNFSMDSLRSYFLGTETK